ncbi:MAG: hypothetical protein JWN86_2611 [Planctomycetota bacterium]|nr:hypothetical protein [Planctomycetota bacterium]
MRKSIALGLPALVVSAYLVGTATFAGDGPMSGVAVGDYAAPFEVQDITGPSKGKSLCYR